MAPVGHILMPWPPSRTNMHFAPEFVCMCVCVLLAQLAGHSLLIIMFFRIKTCFVFLLQQLCRALAVVAKRPSSLFLIALTSNCRRM